MLNSPLIICHLFIFSGFQLLPENIAVPEESKLDVVFDFFDSMAKSKKILDSIKSTTDSDGPNGNIFYKIVIALFASQINKYIFERFLTNRKYQKTFFKPLSVASCILFFSSDLIKIEWLEDKRTMFASSLVIFCGLKFDQQFSESKNIAPKKQGRNKLRPNAKA